jgi:hypothetical protein
MNATAPHAGALAGDHGAFSAETSTITASGQEVCQQVARLDAVEAGHANVDRD